MILKRKCLTKAKFSKTLESHIVALVEIRLQCVFGDKMANYGRDNGMCSYCYFLIRGQRVK